MEQGTDDCNYLICCLLLRSLVKSINGTPEHPLYEHTLTLVIFSPPVSSMSS